MSAQKILHNPLQDFLLIFVTAAACGDLCRSVGRNRMVGFLPRQLTCHHTQQVIGGKFTHSRQLLVMRLVSCQGRKPTTWIQPMLLHKSPQAVGDRGKLTNFMQLLVMTCELPRQETGHFVTTHTPTQVITGSS